MELGSTSSHGVAQCGSPGIGHRSVILIQEDSQELETIILCP